VFGEVGDAVVAIWDSARTSVSALLSTGCSFQNGLFLLRNLESSADRGIFYVLDLKMKKILI
jgi:hypothetical protein